MTRKRLGPRPKSDNEFTARMRLHQSWYRTNVIQAPMGTGPRPSDERHLGNMLTKADAEKGLNFLTPQIHALALRKIDQGKGLVEEFRLLRNMLSSQPMCFNLFGPLANDLRTATALWKLVFPGDVRNVTRVEIEHAPEPAREYLADRTAFDAFVEYENAEGQLRFTGIETKLAEPFSPKKYDRPEYRRWMRGPDSPWRDRAWDAVTVTRHNQLWRDHLLAIAMLGHENSPYKVGRLMLVSHPLDERCNNVVKGYRELLRDDDTFVHRPVDQLLDLWAPRLRDNKWKRWSAAFRERYLDLSASDSARFDD